MSYQHFLQLFDLAIQIHAPRQQIVMAACACARTTLQYIPPGEDRPRLAIETTEKWCRGKATLKQVRQAREKAWQYWNAATDHAARAAGVAAAAAAAAVAADNVAAASAHAAARAHASASKHPQASIEYLRAYQQACREMCPIILQHIPRLKILMVMI